MTQKQRAHWNLDAIIHNCVKNGKDYKSTLELPANELNRELGFSKSDVRGSLKIIITAQFIDNEEDYS